MSVESIQSVTLVLVLPRCEFEFCELVSDTEVWLWFYETQLKNAQWQATNCYLSNRPQVSMVYINNSLHLARKYARIFVRGHYLFRVENSFPKA